MQSKFCDFQTESQPKFLWLLNKSQSKSLWFLNRKEIKSGPCQSMQKYTHSLEVLWDIEFPGFATLLPNKFNVENFAFSTSKIWVQRNKPFLGMNMEWHSMYLRILYYFPIESSWEGNLTYSQWNFEKYETKLPLSLNYSEVFLEEIITGPKYFGPVNFDQKV